MGSYCCSSRDTQEEDHLKLEYIVPVAKNKQMDCRSPIDANESDSSDNFEKLKWAKKEEACHSKNKRKKVMKRLMTKEELGLDEE